MKVTDRGCDMINNLFKNKKKTLEHVPNKVTLKASSNRKRLKKQSKRTANSTDEPEILDVLLGRNSKSSMYYSTK